MDRRSIIVLVVSFIILMVWFPLMNRIYPPKHPLGGTNDLASATNPLPEASPAPEFTNVASLPGSPTPGFAHPTVPEQLLVVENDDARYTFTSHGGGIKLVELKQYPETVGCRRSSTGPPQLATLNSPAGSPAFSLIGSEALQGDGRFTLSKTADGVLAQKDLSNGLHIVKNFRLGTNYILNTSLRLENHSPNALRIPNQEWVIGAATPIGTNISNPNALGLRWYDGNRAESIGESHFANRTFACIPGTPRAEFAHLAGTSNVVWADVHNQFFTMLAMPQQPAYGVRAWRIDLTRTNGVPVLSLPQRNQTEYGYQMALVYPETNLGPQQTLERRFDLYAGPKKFRILSQMENNVVLVMDFGGFFGWFAQVLLFTMNKLHDLGLSYALAILAITITIKLLFWPLTNASTKSMKRMSALQPQMKALQEKYKDDPKKMNLKLMEFMKENKISPLGGCLPMVLQIPVLFGFYRMLQTAIELRGARFLWACDLSQPDTVAMIPSLGFIPFFGIPGAGLPINPLPMMMGATMLWQAHLTPPSPGVDPVQQKIMKYMPLMFIVFFYNISAGLTLYWTMQNLLTILQTKITRMSDPTTPAPKAAVAPVKSGPSPKRRK